MDRPLANIRPFGPFIQYSQEAIDQSDTDCHIVFRFVSPDPDRDSIQDIIDGELPFASTEVGSLYPPNDLPNNSDLIDGRDARKSVEMNTRQNRVDMQSIKRVYDIYQPDVEEMIQIDATPTDTVGDDLVLAQNKFVMVLSETVSLDELKDVLVPELGITSIDTYNEEYPKSLVGGTSFEISTPETVSEAIGVYNIVETQLPLERMFVECINV